MARNTARQQQKSNRFSMIPSVNIRRSVFDRSHDYKTTLDSGWLIPFYVDEVLPGDSFDLGVTTFTRLNTPRVPFMDNLYLDTFFFFVPTRLVWDNWQKFNGEQKNPKDSTDFLVPVLNNGTSAMNFQNGTIFDYFGLPTNVSLTGPSTAGSTSDTATYINSLPFRAYNLIYNEWFRDENLQDSIAVPTGDGPDNISNFTLKKRGKRHDYFTSALPWPQKGPAVDVGLSGNAPVFMNNDVALTGSAGRLEMGSPYLDINGYQTNLETSGSSNLLADWAEQGPVSDPTFYSTHFYGYGGNGETIEVNNLGGINATLSNFKLNAGSSSDPFGYADLADVNAITINDLRQAFQIQKLLERDARGGTRYTEILRAHFGVISPDARLQRPEYLGGSHSRINIVPVQQTSATNDVSPQGNLSAFGLGVNSSKGFRKSFVEHGYIIGLVNIRADLTYQQGLNRMWSRRSRFDFYWPSLAHLGEQAILNQEIYMQGTAADKQVFGYQERYAEYRMYPSMITGKLRSTDPQTLDYWHLAQKFDSLPTLSSQFIEENVPINRVVAVQSEPQFFLDCWFNCKCARPMPVYGVPGLVDHF